MTFRINTSIFPWVVLLLGACRSVEPVPASVVSLPVPVAVNCIDDPPQPPAWQLVKPERQNDANLIKQLMHDALLAKGYIGELNATLSACK